MTKLGKSTYLFFLFFLFTPHAYADDIQVSSSLSDANLEVGDQVTFSITITSQEKLTSPGPDFKPPEIEGLDYMGTGESSSTSMSFNGLKKTATYTRTLNINYACMKEGRYKIPSLDLDLPGGQQTQSVNFVVYKELPENLKKKQSSVAGRRRSQLDRLFDQFAGIGGGGSVFSGQSSDFDPEFFVDLEVNKKEVYEGEQLIVSWYVYISENTTLSSFDTLEFPTLRGFWKEDVNFATRFFWKPVVRNGKRYSRSILSSYALTPYNSGELEVDAFKVRVVASQQSFFNRKSKVIKTESDPVKINVKPLPTPVPDTFYGGVGEFKIDSGNFMEKKEVLLGETFEQKVKIIGASSTTKFFKPPKLDLKKDFKVFSVDEKHTFVPQRASSFKEITYNLVPRKEGLHTIPNTKVSFLDPSSGEYYDLFIKLPPLKVLPNENAKQVLDEDFFDEEELSLVRVDELKLLKTNLYSDTLYKRMPIWLQFVLLLLAIVLSSFLYLKRSKVELAQVSLLERLEKRLERVEEKIASGDLKQALSELINIYSLSIGAVSGKRFGVEDEFKKALGALPPSLKPSRQKIVALNADLQELRFGTSLESKEIKVKLDQCLVRFRDLFSDMHKYLQQSL